MSYHRKLGSQPNKKTPAKKEEKRESYVKVMEGDIILLDKRWAGSPCIGLVLSSAAGKRGSHKVIDTGGSTHLVSKTPSSDISPAFMAEITIVGHDDEWLKMELDIVAKRKRCEINLSKAAWAAAEEIRERKANEK